MLCWRLRFAHCGSQARGTGHSKHSHAKENNASPFDRIKNLQREQKTRTEEPISIHEGTSCPVWLGIISQDEKPWSNPSLPGFALSIFRHGSQLQANVPKCFEILLRCFKRFLGKGFNESSLPQAFDLVYNWARSKESLSFHRTFSSLDREHSWLLTLIILRSFKLLVSVQIQLHPFVPHTSLQFQRLVSTSKF